MLILETENFIITTPESPEMSRKDGGQVDIEEKHHLQDRLLITPDVELELTYLTHLVATAYKKVMIHNGVPIVRLNYQDNGNWAYFTDGVPVPSMHLHIYGRIFESEKQALPNAVTFPDPFKCNDFYDWEPLTNKDVEDLRKEILSLSKTDQFNFKRWYLDKNPILK